ncbi:replicase polyprotein [Elderberry carlavirus D]|uniref:ORF1 protein n=1 Tax=Elderberry carlavirus D TaxID=1569055 RepID=A0A0A7M9C7_9VIRU|nr:replicase polyprotein [Elderberry carlavirus D]AIZ76631.1 replicase polyprotein [Elderberry carlavirus D]
MALTYRSPIEEILASFTSVEQSSISAHAVNGLRKVEQDNYELFNFALSAKAKEKLSRSGIYLSPFSAMPHSHPVCKTLENYMLYKVLPSYIDNTFFFVGIKNSKLEYLKSRDSNLGLLKSINRFVTSKDKLRYGSDFVKYDGTRASHPKYMSECEPTTLSGLLPPVIQNKARNLFFHDELHYWSSDDLINFLSVVRPQTVLATLVYPPELLVGSKCSLNRWCYEYEVEDDELRFFPDGVRSEGYSQPKSGGYLLRTSKIKLDDGEVYCVDLLHSKFAHHLVAITRGNANVTRTRHFGNFEAVSTTGLRKHCKNVGDTFPICASLVSKIYRYLRTLQKPDIQSAMAKLSQIQPEPTGFEIKFVQEFSKFVIECANHKSILNPEFINGLKIKGYNLLPNLLIRNLKVIKEQSLDEFVSGLGDFTFKVTLVELRRGFNVKIDLLDFLDALEESITWRSASSDPVGAVLCSARIPREYRYIQGSVGRDTVHSLLTHSSPFTKQFAAFAFSSMRANRYSTVNVEEVRAALLTVVPMTDLVRGGIIAIALRGGLGGAINRCNIEAARTLKFLYYHSPRLWFTIEARLRFNVAYLADEPVQTAARKNWACVVADMQAFTARPDALLVRGELSRVRVTPWVGCSEERAAEPGFTCPEPSLCSAQLEVDPSDPKGKCVAAEPDQEEDLLKLSCSCGLGFPQGALLRAVACHLPMPDQLKGRRAGWYTKTGQPYTYTGASHRCLGWDPSLDAVLQAVPLPVDAYDCVLIQEYSEGGSIPLHADDEEIFDQRFPILTVCLKGRCLFEIRGSGNGSASCGGVCVFDEGRYLLMPEGFQQSHKHGISVCSAGRISLTFRTLKKKGLPELEEGAQSVDSLDVMGQDELLEEYDISGVTKRTYNGEMSRNFRRVFSSGRGDGAIECAGFALQVEPEFFVKCFKERASGTMPEPTLPAWEQAIFELSMWQNVKIVVNNVDSMLTEVYNREKFDWCLYLCKEENQWHYLLPKNGCVISAIAKSLERDERDVIKVLSSRGNEGLLAELCEGEGLSADNLEGALRCFNIRGIIEWDGELHTLNQAGRDERCFEIKDNHMLSVEKISTLGFKVASRNGPTIYPKSALAVLENAGSVINYEGAVNRANLLAECLLDGATGAISSSLFNEAQDLGKYVGMVNVLQRVVFIMGTFGAGKSTLFKSFLSKCPGKCVTFVSPRRSLAEEIKQDVQELWSGSKNAKEASDAAKNIHVYTFEVFLHRAPKLKKGQVVVIDEVQLYPPGFLDLLAHMGDGKELKLFAAGDPCQSDYDSSKDRGRFLGFESDVLRALNGCSYKYNVMSRRFRNSNLLGRLPCRMSETSTGPEEEYVMCSNFDELDGLSSEFRRVFLVSSFEEKRIVRARYPECKNCLTFGEATGRNFEYGTVIITTSAAYVSERRWLTALSRFSMNLCFLNLLEISFEQLLFVYGDRSLGRFLKGSASSKDLLALLPGNASFTNGFGAKIGKEMGEKELKLAGDPWLKTQIFLGQSEDSVEPEVCQPFMQEVYFKTHLPRYDAEPIRAEWLHRMLSKEIREKRVRGLVTEQFPDEHSKNRGERLTNAAERYEAIYPRHRNSDTATFLLTVRKRLRFSSPAVECAKLIEAQPFGEGMLQLFLKHVPLKPKHNPEFMCAALKAFEDKKCSKSAATIENHSGRSCRDWLADVGLIFMKSQHCTKYEKRFIEAKAGQSIVCFQHSILCRFAPYMRYIELKLMEVLPKNFYVHSGKGLEELNDWVIGGGFNGVCTESDYEAFDASQDQYIMAFELKLMEYLGLPRDLIADYKYIKTHLGSKLGNFAIMRFSGEASTFLFNTMANMLFTFMRYDINGSEHICFAGDDMCASKRLRVSNEYEDFLCKLKLKAKVDFTRTPTFCGWNLTPFGIFKKPQLVYERMCVARETNNLAQCIDNYAIEVSFAYKLGEQAVNRMSEIELNNHYQCVRTIIQNKHLMKSSIVDVFRNQDVWLAE